MPLAISEGTERGFKVNMARGYREAECVYCGVRLGKLPFREWKDVVVPKWPAKPLREE